MRLVPLESLSNFLSNHIKNVPNGVRMSSWRLFQVGPVMKSESSVQNVLALISFHLWAKSDVVSWWRSWGTLRLGPQSTSLILHAFHMRLTLFLIHVCISENVNKQTSWCSNNSSNVLNTMMIKNRFTLESKLSIVVVSEMVMPSSEKLPRSSMLPAPYAMDEGRTTDTALEC